MKEVNLIHTKSAVKTHNLTASIYAGQLVFNEGDYYPPKNYDGHRDEGREYDDYITVAPMHKAAVLQRLLEELPTTSQVHQESDLDEQLLKAIQHVAISKQWRSLTGIEKWLTDNQIPFKKDRWIEID